MAARGRGVMVMVRGCSTGLSWSGITGARGRLSSGREDEDRNREMEDTDTRRVVLREHFILSFLAFLLLSLDKDNFLDQDKTLMLALDVALVM